MPACRWLASQWEQGWSLVQSLLHVSYKPIESHFVTQMACPTLLHVSYKPIESHSITQMACPTLPHVSSKPNRILFRHPNGIKLGCFLEVSNSFVVCPRNSSSWGSRLTVSFCFQNIQIKTVARHSNPRGSLPLVWCISVLAESIGLRLVSILVSRTLHGWYVL